MPIETGASGVYLWSVGGIGFVGTLFGMPLDALILGGLAGAVVQGLHPAASRKAGFFSILMSMLLAGALSQPPSTGRLTIPRCSRLRRRRKSSSRCCPSPSAAAGRG